MKEMLMIFHQIWHRSINVLLCQYSWSCRTEILSYFRCANRRYYTTALRNEVDREEHSSLQLLAAAVHKRCSYAAPPRGFSCARGLLAPGANRTAKLSFISAAELLFSYFSMYSKHLKVSIEYRSVRELYYSIPAGTLTLVTSSLLAETKRRVPAYRINFQLFQNLKVSLPMLQQLFDVFKTSKSFN